MNDTQLAAAAALHFGGRARAEHVLTCHRCHVDDTGRHIVCANHPDKRPPHLRLKTRSS